MRYPLVAGQGNFGSPGNDPAAAMRYTECRMAPLAMEMVRDITENTVDFKPNYDGKESEPVVLPARFPNLLVNGSTGIAVGMATNIPTQNLREVVCGRAVVSGASRRDRRGAARGRDGAGQGAGLPQRCADRRPARGSRTPTGPGAARSSCGRSSTSRRTAPAAPCWWCPSCRTWSTRTTWRRRSPSWSTPARSTGIADIRDDTSARTGQRLVIVLKRDAQPRVVLNNLYKHTQLQDTFGCNMLALVDDVPRTLRLDQFISYWVTHQIEVIQRRTQYRLDQAEKDAHIYRGLVKALDALDEVIALIRRSPNTEEARDGLIALLEIDEIQANAILDMQLRRLAALERQRIIDRLAAIEIVIADLHGHPRQARAAAPDRQRRARRDRRQVRRRAADRRSSPPTATCPTRTSSPTGTWWSPSPAAATPSAPTPMSTGCRSGAARAYAVRRCGRTTRSTTCSRRRTTTGSCSSPTRAGSIGPRSGSCRRRDATLGAATSPDCCRSCPGEEIAQVRAIRDYDDAPYLLLATRHGLVKKTALALYDSPRQAGIIAVHFRDDDDELIGAELCCRDRRRPADLDQGPGDPVPRRRLAAAADGPGDVRGDRDEVPPRRRTAVDVRHSGGCGARTTCMCSPSQTAGSRSVRPSRSTANRAAAGSGSRR